MKLRAAELRSGDMIIAWFYPGRTWAYDRNSSPEGEPRQCLLVTIVIVDHTNMFAMAMLSNGNISSFFDSGYECIQRS